MTYLGGLELPADLVWENEFISPTVAATKEVTVSGDEVVFAQAVNTGTQIDLVAYEDGPWLSRSQVNALVAMAAVPDATYVLQYRGDTYEVRFRHEDAPAVEVMPLYAADNPTLFFGRIKLATL